jgi:hypothetical protein
MLINMNRKSLFEVTGAEFIRHPHIYRYQACENWLEDCRGRELSAENIVHNGKVVVSLKETIRLMTEVDGVIESAGGWPVR